MIRESSRGSLRPTLCIKSVRSLNPERNEPARSVLENFSGITWDLNMTLLGQHEASVPDEHQEVIMAMHRLGLRQGIISNAGSEQRTERVKAIGANLSNLMGEEMLVITSWMSNRKKKPLRPMFDQMSDRMGVPHRRLCHVGDQLLKDVAGANLAEYAGSVLVAPYGAGDELAMRYFQRPLEALIRPLLGLPLHTKNFESMGSPTDKS